ncbi:phage infection protein, partial [Francisella tularensis subsp. holarctica]|nr:phage infection protein [Francisella tularensis subsp. holarctica]
MKLTKTLFIEPLVAGALITSCFAAADNKYDVIYSVCYTMG